MKKKILLALISTLSAVGSLAQNCILAHEAYQHVGEIKEVFGDVYKAELRHYHATPDSALALVNFNDPHDPKRIFTILMKINLGWDSNVIKWIRSIRVPVQSTIAKSKSNEYARMSAEGKIFLFEGRPAIRVAYNELMIPEAVD